MYDTTLSQKYIKDMGICKKKIKDAYPKKVCHMLRHVKREENKRCIPKEGMPHAQACQKKRRKGSPLSKKKEKGEMVHTKEFIHHPPKICTHLHILIKVYDLFLLWIWSLTQQNMRSRFAFKSSIPIAPQKQPLEIG